MEFVLVLPMVMLALLLVVEVTVVARTSLTMLAAAREGVRVAATTVDTDAAIAATHAALGPELAARTRVTVRRPPLVGATAEVTVFTRHRVVSMLGGLSIPLEFDAVMRVER